MGQENDEFVRLLIVTQKVDKNDSVLGFFHRWIEEFAKHAAKVFVITSHVGEYTLPPNVEIFSLGKEKGFGRLRRIWRYGIFFPKYYLKSDAVFFHMCPEFVLAAAPFLISSKKTSGLWYVHKNVNAKLKFAEKLVHYIFTVSELSFRIPSKKVIYTGHAIDTEFFRPASSDFYGSKIVRLLTVGRISPVKDLETIIHACEILRDTWDREWILSIAGCPIMPGDENYLKKLKSLVAEKGLERRINFLGPRSYQEMPDIYREHDILAATTTGAIDKTVLEAMASGLTVITSGEAFRPFLPDKYFLEKKSPEFLAERIKSLADEPHPNLGLRNIVAQNHGLSSTINKIYGILLAGF